MPKVQNLAKLTTYPQTQPTQLNKEQPVDESVKSPFPHQDPTPLPAVTKNSGRRTAEEHKICRAHPYPHSSQRLPQQQNKRRV